MLPYQNAGSRLRYLHPAPGTKQQKAQVHVCRAGWLLWDAAYISCCSASIVDKGGAPVLLCSSHVSCRCRAVRNGVGVDCGGVQRRRVVRYHRCVGEGAWQGYSTEKKT